MTKPNIFEAAKSRYVINTEVMSLEDYLDLAKSDKSVYASPAERLLKAIGEPVYVDTSKRPELGRIFANATIKTYPTFSDFFGIEKVIDNIVSYFKHSAQGLEEKKQILYLLGAVGTAKSSISERLKQLLQQEPIYVLTDSWGNMSPVYESPLGLFSKKDAVPLNIEERYIAERVSPWAVKRAKEYEGDITRFKVTKVYPSESHQIAISKTEPGDENNQDISALVGKVDLKKVLEYGQYDADAYSYTGGLCLANQGILEFVEMFKAPIKVLHPLLTATQEGNYKGTEAISSIPFEGIVLAHSNESEWHDFRNNKNNEAFIDRIYVVKVPYCLRIGEEIKIYKKKLGESSLLNSPIAPHTLEYLARFSILSRLESLENGNILTKARVYNGENIKEEDHRAKTYQEYQMESSIDEGMSGFSTRSAFKVLSKTFNFDNEEVAANPVHLFNVLETRIEQEHLPEDVRDRYIAFIDKNLRDPYKKDIEKEIQTAYLESYEEFGQNKFDRYIKMADAWLNNEELRDPDTGEMWLRSDLEKELDPLEKKADIINTKDFRAEVVQFYLRYSANNPGKKLNWKTYPKMKEVIEKQMFENTESMLPIISFGAKESTEQSNDHKSFVERMMNKGYTAKQVRIVVDWWAKTRKS